jgi:hypothetical protein
MISLSKQLREQLNNNLLYPILVYSIFYTIDSLRRQLLRDSKPC